MKTWIKRTPTAMLLLGVIAAGVFWYRQREKGQPVTFETAKVTRGNIVVTIAASGTLEPEEIVDVGAQISGRILSFGKDTDGRTVDSGQIASSTYATA
jgi:HlyD family secretion protein